MSVLNRRGVIAALLSMPLTSHASTEKKENGATIDLSEGFLLKVKLGGETITLTAEEVMSALRPVTVKELGRNGMVVVPY